MNFKQICTEVSKWANSEKAEEMSRLIGQDHEFVFKGLDANARTIIMKAQLDADKNPDSIDWEFVDTCWEQNIREFQYFALTYLMARCHLLQEEDLAKLEQLIVTKAYWDTNNILHKLVNMLTALHPQKTAEVVAWSKEEDPWLQRTALLFQLGRCEYINLQDLEEVLANSIDSCDPNVRRAILRILSDVRDFYPDFVRDFMEKHPEKISESALEEIKKND